MIHLHTFDRATADEFANQLARKCGIEVYVYRSPDLDGFYILDDQGFTVQIKKSGLLRKVYNPERRASPRVPFRAFVRGRVVGRIANA